MKKQEQIDLLSARIAELEKKLTTSTPMAYTEYREVEHNKLDLLTNLSLVVNLIVMQKLGLIEKKEPSFVKSINSTLDWASMLGRDIRNIHRIETLNLIVSLIDEHVLSDKDLDGFRGTYNKFAKEVNHFFENKDNIGYGVLSTLDKQ